MIYYRRTSALEGILWLIFGIFLVVYLIKYVCFYAKFFKNVAWPCLASLGGQITGLFKERENLLWN